MDSRTLLTTTLLAACCLAAQAQPAAVPAPPRLPQQAQPAAAPPAAPAQPAKAPSRAVVAPSVAAPGDVEPGEPQVRRIVVEDERARISELRVRGVTRRVVVDPKTGIRRSYEVIPNDPSRDPSPAVDSNRGAGGQRVWNVLDF